MSKIADILQKNESELLADWIQEQLATIRRRDLMSDADLQTQSTDLMRSIANAARNGNVTDLSGTEWAGVRDTLNEISASRARQGFNPEETATFVFSLKRPLFTKLRAELSKDPAAMVTELWNVTVL